MTLLRFSAENWRSLRDRQELSLVASEAIKDVEGVLIKPGPGFPRPVLPVAVIYGANASGKSNLISAFEFFRGAIVNSQTRGDADTLIPRVQFALDADSATAPTTMECDFILDGVRYNYGFSACDDAFLEEWLYGFPVARRQMLFKRHGQNFLFGRNLRGRNQVIADLTRKNSLFLSSATQNSHEFLTEITRYFRTIRSDRAISVAGLLASQELAGDELDKRIIQFLNGIEVGIVGHRKREVESSREQSDFEDAFLDALGRVSDGKIDVKALKNLKLQKIDLAHRDKEGRNVYFDLDDESEGTRRLLMILAPAFRALDRGTTMFIDELDASLHTKACEAIIALFSTPTLNPRGAQLVATTHDTNLLNSVHLRRDQVWFTEKDFAGATHLYPLTDIRTRKSDNLERGYLQGRYGAIPFSGQMSPVDETD